jgi:glycosyltransferase involved in cell wall biosynthesis
MISVIIPLYNKAHTIVNTLNTVLRQTFQDFEIVIVNDGSTDNGVEVITTAFNDVRIKIINQANGGVSGARNTGADAAQYNYLAFLDADDEWKLGYLAKIYEAIKFERFLHSLRISFNYIIF